MTGTLVEGFGKEAVRQLGGGGQKLLLQVAVSHNVLFDEVLALINHLVRSRNRVQLGRTTLLEEAAQVA